MIDAILNTIEYYRDNPRALFDDLMGALCVTILTVGMMYLPLFFGD